MNILSKFRRDRSEDIVISLSKGETLQNVGDRYHITRERVRQLFEASAHLKLHDLRRKQFKIKNSFKCWYCGKTGYSLKGHSKRYCSIRCRKWGHYYQYFGLYICNQCGKGFFRRRSDGSTKRFCGKSCQGSWLAKHYGWGKQSHARKLMLIKSAYKHV